MIRNYPIVMNLIYFLQVAIFWFREKIMDHGIIVIFIVILITMIGYIKLIYQNLAVITENVKHLKCTGITILTNV